jgi:hypothetical protein
MISTLDFPIRAQTGNEAGQPTMKKSEYMGNKVTILFRSLTSRYRRLTFYIKGLHNKGSVYRTIIRTFKISGGCVVPSITGRFTYLSTILFPGIEPQKSRIPHDLYINNLFCKLKTRLKKRIILGNRSVPQSCKCRPPPVSLL